MADVDMISAVYTTFQKVSFSIHQSQNVEEGVTTSVSLVLSALVLRLAIAGHLPETVVDRFCCLVLCALQTAQSSVILQQRLGKPASVLGHG